MLTLSALLAATGALAALPGTPATAVTPAGAPAAVTTPAPTPPDPGPPPAGMVPGYDVSWPQCSTTQGGFGNPMPRGRTSFLLLGLSRGSAFTTNPCLATQVAWARSHQVYVAAYVLPTYPTNAEYATQGGRGPYRTTTVTGRLMNVGWQQAAYWVAARRRAGLTAPMVWIDIEQKPGRPWPDRPADRNLPVIRGLLAGFAHAGLLTGIYTTPSHWIQIAGGIRLGRPEWRTVGRRTAADALAGCYRPGVQGSPVLLAQYWSSAPSNPVDYDVMCPITRTGGRLARYFAKY
ncbi:MAG TPA: hypothetical protein VI248_08595 [Kineosporiaceae bacterium]